MKKMVVRTDPYGFGIIVPMDDKMFDCSLKELQEIKGKIV